MNCRKIREHLSEYIDESLEEKTKAFVEEHLSACKDCRQEVASLRTLINDLGSMEPVAPPKDFLDQFHKRMEQRSWFLRALRNLLSSLQVKLPMKFAGAAIMAILVFAIIQVQQDDYGTKMAPLSREKKVVEKGDRGGLKSVPEEEAYNTQLAQRAVKAEPPPKMAEAPGGYEKDVTVAPGGVAHDQDDKVRLAQETEKAKSKPSATRYDEMIVEKDETENLVGDGLKEGTYQGISMESAREKRAPIELSFVMKKVKSTEVFRTTSDTEAPQAQETKMRRTLTVPTTQLERDRNIDDLLPKLREIIERAGGEVVSVEYEEGTHIPESVHVEIPAKQFDAFHNDLKDLGDLQAMPISLVGEEKEILPIRIRLLPSQ